MTFYKELHELLERYGGPSDREIALISYCAEWDECVEVEYSDGLAGQAHSFHLGERVPAQVDAVIYDQLEADRKVAPKRAISGEGCTGACWRLDPGPLDEPGETLHERGKETAGMVGAQWV